MTNEEKIKELIGKTCEIKVKLKSIKESIHNEIDDIIYTDKYLENCIKATNEIYHNLNETLDELA